MKKIISVLLIVFSLFASINFVHVKSVEAYSSKASVVIESSTKRVLYENNKDAQLAMASTTKIMTALITLEHCSNLEENVNIDNRAVGIEGTSIYLKKGETLTVKELLYGLMLASGNDASMALAYHVGKGNLNTFVELMNKKVEELNLTNTSFANPHGLDAENHYTSAYDLAIITSEAMKNKVFKDIVSTPFMQITGHKDVGNRFLRNKQRLLKTLNGCTGVKSGFTDNAGRCLVTSCERDGMELICVVLNCKNMFEESEKLINDAFVEYKMTEILEPYNYITDVKVNEGTVERIKVFLMKGFKYPLKEEERTLINIEKDLPDILDAPLEKEQIIGKIRVFFDKDLIFEENIYTMDSVESVDIKDKVKDIIDKWFYD